MKTFLVVLQLVTALILLFLILIQVKGTGFGRVWGAESVSFTRRGLEKLVFKLTFVVAAIFLVVSFLQLI
jgi:protein translocase SecG subunit